MINDDSDLQSRFEGLKAEDARAVRPISSYWNGARLSVDRRDRWAPTVAALAAGLALLVIASIAIQFRSTRKAAIDPISGWRSPTASLLSTPGDQLFITMPRFEKPLIPLFKEHETK